jgi:hypothetical protein
MQRANPRRPRRVFHKFHRGAPPAAPAILFPKIEFVDERIPPQPFQAVTETQHNVTHRRIAIQNEPREPEVRILQERRQRPAGFLEIEAMPIKRVIRPHEFQKRISVGCTGQPKLWMIVHVEERRFSAAKDSQRNWGFSPCDAAQISRPKSKAKKLRLTPRFPAPAPSPCRRSRTA